MTEGSVPLANVVSPSSTRIVSQGSIVLRMIPAALESGDRLKSVDPVELWRQSEQQQKRNACSADDGLQIFVVMLFFAYMRVKPFRTYTIAERHLLWVVDRVVEHEAGGGLHFAASLRLVPRLLTWAPEEKVGWDEKIVHRIPSEHKSLCCCLAVFLRYCGRQSDRAYALLEEGCKPDEAYVQLLREFLR